MSPPTIEFFYRTDESCSQAPNQARPRQLVCSVWELDGSELGKTIYERQPIASPSHSSSVPSHLKLPSAGDYLVEVIHPGGRSTRRTVKIKESSHLRFELPSQSSSHKSAALASRQITRRFERVVTSAADPLKTRDLEIVVLAPKKPLAGLMNTRNFIANLFACRRHGYKLHKSSNDDVSVELDPRYGMPEDFLIPPRMTWLLARNGNDGYALIALPLSWSNSERYISLQVNAVPPASSEAHWSVSVELLDSAFGTLLDFLAIRDWASAKTTYATAIHAHQINEKSGPYTLAVASYAEALFKEDSELDGSTDASHFKQIDKYAWLPDFAIAHAWLLLRQAESGSEMFIAARALVLRAIEKGFPCFSIGLRILCDSLNYLAVVTPNDEEISSALAAVTRAQLACARGEIFTTIDITYLSEISDRLVTNED